MFNKIIFISAAVGMPAHNRRSAIDPSGMAGLKSSSTDKANALGGDTALNARFQPPNSPQKLINKIIQKPFSIWHF